jgi:Protein of unknown function (DUF1499)
MMGWILGLVALGAVGGMAYVRLAPSDPARWHIDLAAPDLNIEPGIAFCLRPGDRYMPADQDMNALLERLDQVALSTPRTKRVAGAVVEGRITWVTRTAVLGFPDYTTAQVMPGPGLCVVGRQRFGTRDLGVNGRRIAGWMKDLLGMAELPQMNGI